MVTAVLGSRPKKQSTYLPIPPAGFGVLAFTVLMTLLFVTFAFRSVGTRH